MTTGTATVDTEKLKREVDLRGLFGQRVELRSEKSNGAELSGPCPKCGGRDRLHVREDAFFCRTCHGEPARGKPWHDAIEAVQFLGLAQDFLGACAVLSGGTLPAPAGGARRKPENAKAAAWRDPTWQREALAQLRQAQDVLASPAGDPGANYLFSRGLTVETWEKWGLGYGLCWHPQLREPRAAIVMPWQGAGTVKALQYRFCWPGIEKGQRFGMKAGGERTIFGVDLLGQHGQTLWIVEGELNALSLWQALRTTHCVGYDVVSFGPEGNAAHDAKARALARRYRQAIAWADKPEVAAAIAGAIPNAQALRSPQQDGRELDANELLKAFVLADFARLAWAKLDADPAYVARVRAELEQLTAGETAEAGFSKRP